MVEVAKWLVKVLIEGVVEGWRGPILVFAALTVSCVLCGVPYIFLAPAVLSALIAKNLKGVGSPTRGEAMTLGLSWSFGYVLLFVGCYIAGAIPIVLTSEFFGWLYHDLDLMFADDMGVAFMVIEGIATVLLFGWLCIRQTSFFASRVNGFETSSAASLHLLGVFFLLSEVPAVICFIVLAEALD